jgi:hypothetical protein
MQEAATHVAAAELSNLAIWKTFADDASNGGAGVTAAATLDHPEAI